MDIAVLLKVVPDLAQLRWDAASKSVRREGSVLFANPFDQRALRVALDLRRPGEVVSVISMGPPGAITALRESLALGADRAFLLSDPRLAGSDTLVTARSLVRALGLLGHELVLTGRSSTDSEREQVGPQVAGLLGLPVVSGLREIIRDDGGTGLEVVADTEVGWRRLRVRGPAVLTVGEKIAKVRKVSPSELEAVPAERVGRLDLAALGIEEGSVGLLGSPTVVDSLSSPAPTRGQRTFIEGAVPTRVAEAVQLVEDLLLRRRHGSGDSTQVPPLPEILADEAEVLVLVTGDDGGLSEATLSILAESRRDLRGHWPCAIWAGSSIGEEDSRRISEAGAARGYHLRFRDGPVSSWSLALALQSLLAERPRAAALIILSDSFGRETAGQLSARAGLGLTGDATSMRVGADRRIFWGKPSFGGNVIAEIVSRTRPSLATVRPGALPKPLQQATGTDALGWTERPVPGLSENLDLLDTGMDLIEGMGNLDTARVALCVGMGLGGPDHLPAVLPALHRWDAALAATRRVVDAGWLPRQLQVGLTGRNLSPDLVVLLGVSGSTNQLVGWRRAGVILAIDANPNAPVFAGVDVGVVGRWEDVWPRLSEALDPVVERLNATPR